MKTNFPSRRSASRLLVASLLCIQAVGRLGAQTPAPPLVSFTKSNAHLSLAWTPYPAAQQYSVFSGTNLAWPLLPDTNGAYNGYNWSVSNATTTRFYGVKVTPLSSNDLLSASVLNRLAYGPTPDELERLRVIGPQAYIDEQLAPETIAETGDDYTALTVVTNSALTSAQTNWSLISVTGAVSSSTLYLYLTAAGDAYIDDVALRLIQNTVATNLVYDTNSVVIGTNYVTNFFLGNNVLTNGDFELPVTDGWTVSANMASSSNSAAVAHSGASSLHLVASSPGSGQASSLWQTVSPTLPTTNNQQCVLSFWYLPTAQSHLIYLRLSGSGTIISGLDAPPPVTWIYATATGIATATPRLYIYPSGAGETYLDDIKLVRGSVAEAGTNLLRNGDFELPLTNGWQFTADFTNSTISTNVARSGSAGLKLVATGAGGGSGDSMFQDTIAGVTNNGIYTLSFWYIPSTRGQTLTARFSGSGTAGLMMATPDSTLPGIRRRLDNFGAGNPDHPDGTLDTTAGASLADLKAWFVMNAVGAKRQLLEVLSQFLENHFVTQYSKSFDYITGIYNNDGTVAGRITTEWEYREQRKWRAALLRGDCTFYDLLKISAESPAMIVYLDTVSSRGDGKNVANENYARELFELFCMGVDNGYEQNDIVAQSRAWTGWSVDIVDKANIDNPLAPRSINYGFYPGSGAGGTTNLVGVWTFNYKTNYHGTNSAPLLSVWHTNSTSTNLIPLGPKIVPDRFGPPWAGQPYQLTIPRRTNGQTNSIQDGYDVIWHLANNVPMTAEYISVKLCRLFVHDNFPNPTTRTDLPEYNFYDYRRSDLSPEATLVHDCMLAWWSSSPRGNMRAVLQTIFNSELFRSHGGSLQKVKTPLEYCVSAVRALRAANGSVGFTASTDGYSISGTGSDGGSYALSRMGNMLLFNRDAPDGYPENGPPWISAGTLAERIRFIQTLLMAPADTARVDGNATGSNNSLTDPVALLVRKGVSTTDAAAVADYFLGILYPAEGAGNLAAYRTLALNFLNTADDGVTPSLFSTGLSAAVRDTRVRGLVSMLMTLQRFQEQ